ncbi:ROK family glucokinase [Velocimicrobium porci]|uniref:Glucokinase n=1 Tax=Velocimicrobium porci TaxID=2606634 RepID=A0A6L5XVZ1_9FIRM|nr:ROK family glucokinase [Velocimicrobium porci]MSS62764.1 ROK family glucokinase [Velocimicrobium porci]
MSRVCVGVDIGGTSVKIGIFTTEGIIQKKWEIPTRKEESGIHILEDVALSIQHTVSEMKLGMEEIIGIGIGVPGPVVNEKKVIQCVNLGWENVEVADKMKELTGIENIKVANDANVAALGEMWKGGGEGYKSIVMVTLGTGVGGGIIADGKILTGSNGAAGEIGHVTVNPSETVVCNCDKRGCLEQYASATGIVRETKKALEHTDKDTVLKKAEHLSAKMIFDAAKAGDEFAKEMVENLGYYLGLALGTVAQVVDPEAFVIGGGVSRAGDILIKTIERYYDKYVMMALKNKTFCLATLGNDAGIYGSAKLILD